MLPRQVADDPGSFWGAVAGRTEEPTAASALTSTLLSPTAWTSTFPATLPGVGCARAPPSSRPKLPFHDPLQNERTTRALACGAELALVANHHVATKSSLEVFALFNRLKRLLTESAIGPEASLAYSAAAWLAARTSAWMRALLRPMPTASARSQAKIDTESATLSTSTGGQGVSRNPQSQRVRCGD
jgi:hypothetical protein